MLVSEIIKLVCQTSFKICEDFVSSTRSKRKLRKKIDEFAENEFASKFAHLDLSSEIDFDGLATYLQNSLINEIESFITTPSDGAKKAILSMAFNSANANNSKKKAIVTTFIESVIAIMKQDFINNVDASLRVFANDLVEDFFVDVKTEIVKNKNEIVNRIDTLDASNNMIIGSQAMAMTKIDRVANDVACMKNIMMQQSDAKSIVTNVSVSNPLDLLRDIGVSVNESIPINVVIKYDLENQEMSVRFCVKRKGKIAEFNSTEEYLAHLNFTMLEDTVDVVSSVIMQDGKKTEVSYDDNYTGAVCYLPWLSSSEMEVHSTGLSRFADSHCISSKLTITPKQIQVVYNIENENRDILWQGIKYKLRRSVENDKYCCYFENEVENNKIGIDIKFVFETTNQSGKGIINPHPDISISIEPKDRYNARSLLEHYQALLKVHLAGMLRFIDVKTMEHAFSCNVDVSSMTDDDIRFLVDFYKKIVDIEEYFKTAFKLKYPMDISILEHINLIHGLVMNKKVTVNHSEISINSNLESPDMKVGSLYGWVTQVELPKLLFDKELPIENVIMVCPSTKYIKQEGEIAVLKVVGKTIYFWDLENEIYSNLDKGFSKVMEAVGCD